MSGGVTGKERKMIRVNRHGLKYAFVALLASLAGLLAIQKSALAYETIPMMLEYGAIKGEIRFEGQVPKSNNIRVNADANYCGYYIKDNQFVVDKNGGLKNAIVSIENITRGKEYAKKRIVISENKRCRFEPHVITAVKGQKLGIVSRDPILHNTKLVWGQGDIDGPGWKQKLLFNIAIPMQDVVIKKKLKKTGQAKVICDAHDWMKGYVVIFDHPYAEVTTAEGQFQLTKVPPGNYRITIWHEQFGRVTKDVVVRAREVSRVNHVFK